MQTTKNGVREIAKLAKVSIGTVSNVMNHPEVVAVETVERVNAAMAQLGYQVGARKKGRQILAFGDTARGKALIEKVEGTGLEIQAIDVSDETKREKLLNYLMANKSAAAALLIVTQAGAMASELGNILQYYLRLVDNLNFQLHYQNLQQHHLYSNAIQFHQQKLLALQFHHFHT